MAELEILIPNDLGLSGQALAILALLCDRELYFEDVKASEPLVIDIKSRAWYNGRERGVCLIVEDHSVNQRTTDECRINGKLCIVFGENRSSDNIFVDCWLDNKIFNNPPTPEHLPDGAYDRRRAFDYGRVDQAERYVRNLIEEFLADDLVWDCHKCGHGGRGESGLDHGHCPECGKKPDVVPASVRLKKLR
jgi:hypothetical protein